jgi:hypothetical protein
LNKILVKYPENKVIEAADKVRKAQKSTRDGELLDPRALGIPPREKAGRDITRMRFEAFWDLLDPSENGSASASTPVATPIPTPIFAVTPAVRIEISRS